MCSRSPPLTRTAHSAARLRDDNRDICKALGVKASLLPCCSSGCISRLLTPCLLQMLPYFHFYKGAEGKIAAFTASLSKLQRLRCADQL